MSRLKLFRKANNLKQEELAEELGVSRSFISQVEAGHSKMPKTIWDKILNNTCGWETEMLVEEESNENFASEDKLITFLKEQNDKLTQENIELHSRIAVLEYQIMMLEREKGKTATGANNSVASVG